MRVPLIRGWSRRPSEKQRRVRRFRQNLLAGFESLEDRRLLNADPGPNPVIFVPGFGGTFAADQTPQGVEHWYMNRGLPPDQLALEPNGQIYQNIVKTLENVGYVMGQTLFVTTWDWRVPAAPLDHDAATNRDGILSDVTAAGISDSVFETGLDYLGYTLRQAADAYAAANEGQTLEHVDIISHSTGGLVARAYIQSTAYGQDGLPEVANFVMSGVPNEGATEPWNFLRNDWDVKTSARALSWVVDNAFDRLQAGQTVFGPDPNSTDDDISDPSIDHQAFIRQYVGSLQNLLPTYPVLDSNGDGINEVVDSGDQANLLLLDLNGGEDKNGYIDRTMQTIIQFSQQDETRYEIDAFVGPHPKGFFTDSILPFTNFIGRSPEPNQPWFFGGNW